MIKFFRHIRKQLLVENKTGHYIKYAIGEIILVVIGILIALSINNWNESQKDEAEAHIYLTNLRGDLNDDIASLESNISFNKIRLKGIFYILEHSELNTQTFTEMKWIDVSKNDNANHIWKGSFPDSLNRKFTNLAFSMLGRGFGGVAFNKSVINELYSTGSFSNIQSANLKSKIGDYYSFLAQRLEGYAIEEHEEWANETTRFFTGQVRYFHLRCFRFKRSYSSFKGQKRCGTPIAISGP
jgi:hypothetical protein